MLVGGLLARRGDPYWSSNVLSLRMNGANGGTTFTDLSNSPKTVTAQGAAQTSTAQYKWYGSSCYLDNASGSADYVNVAAAAALSFGNSDCTITGWFRPIDITNNLHASAYKWLVSKWGGANCEWLIAVDNTGKLYFTNSNNGSSAGTLGLSSSAGVISVDTWYHIEVTRASGTWRLFLNGTSVASGVDANTYTPGVPPPLTIGKNPDVSAGGFEGYIQDFQIYKGAALHTANFSVPTGPFIAR